MCYEPSLLRRDFVKGGVGAAMAVAGFPAFRLPRLSDLRRSSERPYLEAALQAAKWIELSRATTDHGVTWPADPNDANSLGNTLYTHSPGVVTFLLELFHTTGDAAVLSDAMAGADHLADEVGRDRDSSAGLYTGLAGLAFVMEETYRASGHDQYRRHAVRCLSLIKRNARPAGAGRAWPVGNGDGASREVNDIISGTAGTGLGLLYADRMMGDPEAVELAELADNVWLSERFPRAPISNGTSIPATHARCQTFRTAPPAFAISWRRCTRARENLSFSTLLLPVPRTSNRSLR